jgi:hypothetical protein
MKQSRMIIGLLGIFMMLAATSGETLAARGDGEFGRGEIKRMVVQEAMRSRLVPPSLALAVAQAESDFQADAKSSAGARGVMQIMPATGFDVFGVRADELWEPRLNIQIGIAFLEDLIEQYDGRWELALSHYNGGSAVGRGARAKVIPATRGYVRKVLRLQRRFERDRAVAGLIDAVGERNTFLAQAHAEQEAERAVEPVQHIRALRPRNEPGRQKSKPTDYPHTSKGGMFLSHDPDRWEDREWLREGEGEQEMRAVWKRYVKVADGTLKEVDRRIRRAKSRKSDRYDDLAELYDEDEEYSGAPSSRFLRGIDAAKARFRRALDRES